MSDRSTLKQNAVHVSRSEPAARRPYQSPRLSKLGSVRELTLGPGSGPFEDFSGFQRTP
jgi:hypothetical protein